MAQGRGPGGPFMRGYMSEEEKASAPKVTKGLLKRTITGTVLLIDKYPEIRGEC